MTGAAQTSSTLLQRLLRWRIVRFGTVGASGVVVNLAALFVAREFLFAAVANDGLRLSLSLAVAITAATVNNFAWNRSWTWQDRHRAPGTGLVGQFVRYASACWLGILLQFGLTRLLAGHMHYLVANLSAIGAASLFNFLLNDRWTFRRSRAAAGVPALDERVDRS